jgi:uncharacterized protein (DUF488 family)
MFVLPEKEIFTVGHSTRTWEEFVGLLREHEIGCLIDVRIAPTSRRMPHFGKQWMESNLPGQGITYVHEPGLGGRRRPAAGSTNTGWHNRSFQAYADHMATAEFAQALDRVMGAAERRRTAIMCAEAVWWRCHRMLISDALTVRGWRVLHIGTAPSPQPHRLTPFAVVAGEDLSYPPAQGSLPLGADTA